MAILPIKNSFVTFYDFSNDAGRSNYITDTECGIQNDFCYPINNVNDLAFQMKIVTTADLTSDLPTIFRVINGTGSQISDASVYAIQTGTYMGVTPIYTVYFAFASSSLLDNLSDGDCFSLYVSAGLEELQEIFISNECFKYSTDTCLTSRLTYINNSNAFGFYYDSISGQTPYNKIRLPVYFKEPQLPVDKNVYTKSNGDRVLLSARVSKKYKGYIDATTEQVHQNLVIALNHNYILWLTEGNYQFLCRFEDEYNNEFPTIMQNVNTWPADFTIFETPFDNFNSNCG